MMGGGGEREREGLKGFFFHGPFPSQTVQQNCTLPPLPPFLSFPSPGRYLRHRNRRSPPWKNGGEEKGLFLLLRFRPRTEEEGSIRPSFAVSAFLKGAGPLQLSFPSLDRICIYLRFRLLLLLRNPEPMLRDLTNRMFPVLPASPPNVHGCMLICYNMHPSREWRWLNRASA